ncbi:MAG: virulence RhuM family protein, partial [Gammaproteobacteria bacterium]|nr:virulence RhuM family protein [Gammaproteobacteria bacterium]
MNDIAFYEITGSALEVRIERETVWLSRQQLAQLFGRDRSVIGRHISAVFTEGELDEKSNVQKMHIPPADKPIAFYNLDVIISVGYRVKSPEGVRFRQWASRILKDYLVRGYALDRRRLEANASELEAALQLVRSTLASPELTGEAGVGLADIITRYTQTFLWLQRYDEGLLTDPKGHPGGILPT